MKQLLLSSLVFLAIFCAQSTHANTSSHQSKSRWLMHENFPSKFVNPRNVEVWLPPGYNPSIQYPVLYVHDGQNVFNPSTSYTGIAWEIDSVAESLIAKGKIIPPIVVAVWNSPLRFLEYMPNKPAENIRQQLQQMGRAGEVISDNYLRFLVEELKPFIDRTYSTNPAPSSTFIMGASMGGLISLYAVMEYPHIFGGAACLSTHWPALNGVVVDHLQNSPPDPNKVRLYFDHGTINLDSLYHPFQQRVDAILTNAGFVMGENLLTLKFEGADHNERAWRDRVYRPLLFLLGKSTD